MKYWDFYHHFNNQLIVRTQEIENYFGTINFVQLNQWLEKGLIIQLRRGIYIFKDKEADLNLIANNLKTSYISLESALSYYQLIPETVFDVSSMTTEKPEKIKTPLATFVYYHIKKELFFDYQLIESGPKNRVIKIALPEKALFDLVYSRPDLNDKASLEELRLLDYNFSISRFKNYLKHVRHKAIKNRINNLIDYIKERC